MCRVGHRAPFTKWIGAFHPIQCIVVRTCKLQMRVPDILLHPITYYVIILWILVPYQRRRWSHVRTMFITSILCAAYIRCHHFNYNAFDGMLEVSGFRCQWNRTAAVWHAVTMCILHPLFDYHLRTHLEIPYSISVVIPCTTISKISIFLQYQSVGTRRVRIRVKVSAKTDQGDFLFTSVEDIIAKR